MYLSYTGFKTFVSCPRRYYHQYVAKTKLATPENKVNSLYGTIVGTLFETFYNERIWKGSGVEQQLQDLVPEHYARAIRKEMRDGAIRWKSEDPKANYANPEVLIEDVRKTIPRGISIIRHHRLLGPEQSDAEVVLDHKMHGYIIGGRADFIIRRIAPHRDLVLIDGKGSKWRGKYVDDRQLRWYAMLHRRKFGFAPDKLGFVFWRFDPDQSLDWVDGSKMLLDELETTAWATIREIEAKTASVSPDNAFQVFPSKPGGECKLCTYLTLCAEGEHFVSTPVPILGGVGVEDVGF